MPRDVIPREAIVLPEYGAILHDLETMAVYLDPVTHAGTHLDMLLMGWKVRFLSGSRKESEGGFTYKAPGHGSSDEGLHHPHPRAVVVDPDADLSEGVLGDVAVMTTHGEGART